MRHARQFGGLALTILASPLTTIRPHLPQAFPAPSPTGGSPQDAAKLAAARAFFAAAMGQTPAPSLGAAQAPPGVTARIAGTPAEAPQKILRPGSLIDIRV